MNKRTITLAILCALLVSACTSTATQVLPSPTPLPPTATQQPTDTPLPPTATQLPTEPPVQPTAAQTQPSPTPVKVYYWSWANIQEQVDEWNQAHPEIHVYLVSMGISIEDLNSKVQNNMSVPDVIQIEYPNLPGFIDQGVLANLVDYGANGVKDQFDPQAWSRVSQGDVVFA